MRGARPEAHLNGWRGVHENRATGRRETMLIDEARLESERSSRCLAQLCRNFNDDLARPVRRKGVKRTDQGPLQATRTDARPNRIRLNRRESA